MIALMESRQFVGICVGISDFTAKHFAYRDTMSRLMSRFSESAYPDKMSGKMSG